MGIWMYIPGRRSPKDKKNYKNRFLITFRSISNNSLMRIINLQCGIKDVMFPKVEWPQNNFSWSVWEKQCSMKNRTLNLNTTNLFPNNLNTIWLVKTLCYYFMRTLICFSMYKVLPTKGTMRRSKIGQEIFEIAGDNVLRNNFHNNVSHKRERTLLSWKLVYHSQYLEKSLGT